MSNKVFTDGDVTKFLDSYGEPAPHEWKDYMEGKFPRGRGDKKKSKQKRMKRKKKGKGDGAATARTAASVPPEMKMNEQEMLLHVSDKIREFLHHKRARVIDIFRQYDVSGDGRIDKEELGMSMEDLGLKPVHIRQYANNIFPCAVQ